MILLCLSSDVKYTDRSPVNIGTREKQGSKEKFDIALPNQLSHRKGSQEVQKCGGRENGSKRDVKAEKSE